MLGPVPSNESTASRLLTFFDRRGVNRSEIDGDLISPLYRVLNRSAYSPQGKGIILPKLDSADHPVEDQVWGVIAESRQHPALEYVVNKFCDELNIGIQLFHGTANERFIRQSSLSRLIEQEKLVLTLLQQDRLSPIQYNALFLSEDFWGAIKGRHKILVFQTDAMVCSSTHHSLDDFLDFDYIGPKWPRNRPVGIVIEGGYGGLSLRDWSKSVQCLKRFPAAMWPGGEDGYFAFHIELMGGRVGKPWDCARFATQNEFLDRSFGAHKISDLDEDSLKRFVAYCPEAAFYLDSAKVTS